MIDIKTVDRNFVKSVFRNRKNYDWSIQGFGFLRTYLDPKQIFRLHIWIPDLRVENVSDIHDHPWDFESKIIWGELINHRYQIRLNPLGIHDRQTIRPGEDAMILGNADRCDITQVQKEVYFTGGFYSQKAEEVHRTEIPINAVSIIKRKFTKNRERAFSFHQTGRPWVDAKPRPATTDEVLNVIQQIEPYF